MEDSRAGIVSLGLLAGWGAVVQRGGIYTPFTDPLRGSRTKRGKSRLFGPELYFPVIILKYFRSSPKTKKTDVVNGSQKTNDMRRRIEDSRAGVSVASELTASATCQCYSIAV
ncbi:hypothetical protein HYDPIDRAFT_119318 [Hydnomerulius pinastri MD-312]|uniref:Uncharacterized protein n=1 Tax=Hydnomerulius pinastri MD-312 TaxID=994086 RepID=A0A0C9W7A1_9AGAM|nr:hypothetical protein HYDPIDRAFT_119318 [Hydnomerulius pinastri MD-312]